MESARQFLKAGVSMEIFAAIAKQVSAALWDSAQTSVIASKNKLSEEAVSPDNDICDDFSSLAVSCENAASVFFSAATIKSSSSEDMFSIVFIIRFLIEN